jgi:hypothetical protein
MVDGERATPRTNSKSKNERAHAERKAAFEDAGACHNVESMTVELLFWEGCPSHPKALAELRAAMSELGLDPNGVVVREVSTDADAERERFVGSPTIRIDGADVQPPVDEPYGLTCRVYHRRDGRVSPTPDPADLRDALASARPERK